MGGDKKLSKLEKQAEMLRQNLLLRKKQTEGWAKLEKNQKHTAEQPVDDAENEE